MFALNSNPISGSSTSISIISGSNGIPPYDITLSSAGTIEKIDDISVKFIPDILAGNYIAVFWGKDQNNALARCSVKIQN